MTTAQLQSVTDIGQGDELAAVERDERGDAEAPAGQRGDQSGGERLIPVNHVERAIPPQRAGERRVLPKQSPWPSEIVNRCAEQRIAAWLLVVPQGVHGDLVPPRQPLDEPKQSRGDALAPAAIDPARHDERDPHHRRVNTETRGCAMGHPTLERHEDRPRELRVRR